MKLFPFKLVNNSKKQCCLLIAICYLTINVGCSEQGVDSTEDDNSPMEVSWQAPALVELGKPAKYSIEIEDNDGIDSLRVSLESADDGEHDTTIVETPNSNSYKGSWSVISDQQGDHLFRYFVSDKLEDGDEFDSTYVTTVRPFENYTRKGTVLNDITREPIEKAVLRISKDGELVDEDTTDSNGDYTLTVRHPRDSTRKYLLMAQSNAYQDYEQNISINSDGDYVLTLKPNPVTYDYRLDLVVNPGDSIFVKRGDIIEAINWGGARVDSLGVIIKGELQTWRDQQNGEDGVWFKPNEGVTTDQEYGINAKSSTGIFETFIDTLHVE